MMSGYEGMGVERTDFDLKEIGRWMCTGAWAVEGGGRRGWSKGAVEGGGWTWLQRADYA